MRTKYLLAAAAMASLFAACSQDEVFNSSEIKSDLEAARPKVMGEVVFNDATPTTRYNNESATVEDKDVFGAYLMDEFCGYADGKIGEQPNANNTLWRYQDNWWQMYTMVDYIQTNYGYVYNAEKRVWENPAAQLNEGNYILMFPKNDAATNRRDLWQYINPVVTLAKHSDEGKGNYYVNRDNQFFLDYAQIYRDDNPSVDGVFQLDVKLKAVLTYLKIVGWNQTSTKFRAKKIVFKAPQGKPLPTIAYVKPARQTDKKSGYAYWVTDDQEAIAKEAVDECGNILGEGLYNPATFTQQWARELVQYDAPINQIPYGLKKEDQTIAYEYSFIFPGENGLELGANTQEGEDCTFTASIALPAFRDFEGYSFDEMEVVIYGEMYDKGTTSWRSGLLMYRPGNQNQKFTLHNLKIWESGQDIPTVQVYFDDHSFVQGEEIRVESTEDLVTLLKARLTEATTTMDVDFEVYPYGKGLTITDEVVSIIKDYEKKTGNEVNVTFKSDLTQEQTPVILEAADCINMFNYSGVNVIANANQTSSAQLLHIATLTNNATMTLNAGYEGTSIVNTGALAIGTTEEGLLPVQVNVTTLHNENLLVLNNTTIKGKVENANAMNVSGDATVTVVINDNNCIECGKTPAVLTVEETGKLTVETLLTNTANDKVIVDGSLIAEKVVNEEEAEQFDINATSSIVDLTNSASINITAGVTALGSQISDNYGTISVAEGAELAVSTGSLNNHEDAVINVEGYLWDKIKNSGLINVIKNGHVITSGYVGNPGIIDVTKSTNSVESNAAKDSESYATYFRYTVGTETSASVLKSSLSARISAQNYGKNPIILCWSDESAATFIGEINDANVKFVSIERDLAFTGKVVFPELKEKNEDAFVVAAGTTSIANGATLTLGEGSGIPYKWSVIYATITEGASFHVNNTGKTLGGGSLTEGYGKNVTVYGAGTVSVDGANKEFAWNKASSFSGKWWK